MQKKYVVIHIVLIIILGFLTYANSLNGKFLWDDDFLVKNNVYIKNWTCLPKIFTENIGAGARSKYIFYRPLQMITYMIDYSFWKSNPAGYHLTNIFIHILVALCIYWFINIIFGNKILAFLTSIFFLIHPIHTEVASYISGRCDSLAFLFILSAFILYIKQLHFESITTYIFMLLCYILALLSKENSLILPALLWLYHYTFKVKFKNKEFLSILSLAFLYSILRLTLLRGLLSGEPSNTTVLERLPGFFVATANYLRLLFLPQDLHMEYGSPLFKFTDPKALAGMAILFSSVIFAFLTRKKNRLISFALLWFFIALFPVSNLYPVNAYMAEHWLYVPSMGFFLLLAYLLSSLYKRKESRIFTIILTVTLSAPYAYLAIRQNNYWSEPINFYERTLKYTPYSPRMLNNLGDAYDKIGKQEKAIVFYKEAIKFDVNCAEAYNNLGNAYVKLGKNEDAIAYYKAAIAINPNYAEIYNNLASVYAIIGKYEDAILILEKAIEADPNYAMLYNNLAAAYFNKKEYDSAIKYCDKAITLGYKVDPVFLKLLEPFRDKK